MRCSWARRCSTFRGRCRSFLRLLLRKLWWKWRISRLLRFWVRWWRREFVSLTVRARRDRRERSAGSGRSARRVANAEDRASRLARRNLMVALAAGVKAGLAAALAAGRGARALESASDGRFSAIAQRVRSRALRVRGMRSAHHDRDAKRVSGLRARGLIARTRNGAEARSGS